MHGLWRRVVEILRPRRLDRETVDELSQHVELLVDRKMAAGLDERQARRQALAEVGSVSSAREQIAEERTGFSLDQLARELTYAARVLRRSPGVTLLSILTMGVGIGASTVLFMLVNAIVLRPLPYPEPERLVRIFDTNPQIGVDRADAASGNVEDWRRRTGAFDGISAYYVMGRTVGIGGEAEVLLTAQVRQDFFELLRVVPLVGRSFTADETRRALFNSAAAPIGADPVVMLSQGVWMRRFGGHPDVVGQVITVERRPFRIIGVMPARFALPDAAVQLWIPWGISSDDPRDQHYAGVLARLKKGLSIGQAEDMLNNVARELGAEYPTTNRGWGARISPLAVEIVGGTAAVLWILLASVSLVLLIACANVGLLSLMRALDSSDETAARRSRLSESAFFRRSRQNCRDSTRSVSMVVYWRSSRVSRRCVRSSPDCHRPGESLASLRSRGSLQGPCVRPGTSSITRSATASS
jgi:putative ABC transport system permease protein